jgi:RES domain-containing protein
MKPIEGRAAEGRANPKGIPVLYLSTRQETAMSEVRPWLGSFVSCALFRTTRLPKIAQFTVNQGGDFYYFDEPDDSEKEKAVWTQIDHTFSEPTTSNDDTADYVPTQVIAELFKTAGYDGIAYKSAFGDDGCNIALFNLADAELTACALHEVKSLKFSFSQQIHTYRLKADGSAKTT